MALYFVAGGTSGIGRACVEMLLNEGNDVVAIGKSEAHASETKADLGARFGSALHVAVGDLTDTDFVRRISTSGSGPVAGLVNSAGSISAGGIDVEDSDTWKFVVTANLDTVFNLTKALLPRLRESQASAIVNVSSVCSLRPCTSLSYSVSKAGLDMFTKCLARDLAPEGIRVNSVNPGVTKTNLQMSAQLFSDTQQYSDWVERMVGSHPLGRVGEPDDVASLILYLLSEASSWVTGAIISIDGGRAVA